MTPAHAATTDGRRDPQSQKEVVRMGSFAVVVFTRPNYEHAEAFREFAEAVYHGLEANGEDVTWSDSPFVPGRTAIVFGANLATHPAEIPPHAIIFNLEQIDASSSWLREPYLTLLRTHQVWDYSARNVEALRERGVTDVHHVPVGWARELERVAEAPKDLDVLFYGSLNPRRQQIIDQLRAAGVNVTAVFGVYGPQRDALIARARVVLNVHFYESKIFEAIRVSYLLGNGATVLSEDGGDPIEAEFQGAVAFAPYDGLVARCLELLADDAEREAYGARGRALMRARPQAGYLRGVLDRLAPPPPTAHPTILNIGSGKDWNHQWLNLDIDEEWGPDVIFDLNEELPASGLAFSTRRFGDVKFLDEVFELIICNDVLEHLTRLSTAMTTCLRLLKPGGVLRVNVPYDLSWGAWQDPTHVRAFNERSWLYYTDWFWYMGWDAWRFDLTSLTYLLSPIGQQMAASHVDQETIVRTPRAVDSMLVELTKRKLSDDEHREFARRHPGRSAHPSSSA